MKTEIQNLHECEPDCWKREYKASVDIVVRARHPHQSWLMIVATTTHTNWKVPRRSLSLSASFEFPAFCPSPLAGSVFQCVLVILTTKTRVVVHRLD